MTDGRRRRHARGSEQSVDTSNRRDGPDSESRRTRASGGGQSGALWPRGRHPHLHPGRSRRSHGGIAPRPCGLHAQRVGATRDVHGLPTWGPSAAQRRPPAPAPRASGGAGMTGRQSPTGPWIARSSGPAGHTERGRSRQSPPTRAGAGGQLTYPSQPLRRDVRAGIGGAAAERALVGALADTLGSL